MLRNQEEVSAKSSYVFFALMCFVFLMCCCQDFWIKTTAAAYFYPLVFDRMGWCPAWCRFSCSKFQLTSQSNWAWLLEESLGRLSKRYVNKKKETTIPFLVFFQILQVLSSTQAGRVPFCKFHLGDRPIPVTFKRAIAALSLWQKARLAWGLCFLSDPIRYHLNQINNFWTPTFKIVVVNIFVWGKKFSYSKLYVWGYWVSVWPP